MSRRSEALKVIPYRGEPEDLDEYAGPVEASHCKVCHWADARCHHPQAQDKLHFCISTNLQYPDNQWWRDAGKGECPGYRPSLLTRTLRLVGLRKPVMR